MGKHNIRYTAAAVDDLDGIFSYISEDDRAAALKMLDRIEGAILKLGEMPRLGAVLPTNELSLVESGYRLLVVEPYIVFYRIRQNEVWTGRVLHSRQDWLHLLFGAPAE